MTRELIEPPCPKEYKLRSFRALLAGHEGRLAELGIKIEDTLENDDEEKQRRKVAFERAQAHTANISQRIRAAINRLVRFAFETTQANYVNLDARRLILYDSSDAWKAAVKIWYCKVNGFPTDPLEYDPVLNFAVDSWFRDQLNKQRKFANEAIQDRVATVIACGADAIVVMREIAVAVAQGQGDRPESYPDHFRDLMMSTFTNPDRIVPTIEKSDFDLVGELTLQQNGIEALAYGAFTSKFYLNDKEIPKVVIESLIRNTLATLKIVDDENDGELVSVDRRMVGEVYATLTTRLLIDDSARKQRALAPSIAGSAPMLTKMAGPEFDHVLVKQAGAPPVAFTMIMEACAEVWADFCARSGTVDNKTNFGTALNKWGGSSIDDTRLTIGGQRVSGYRGIRILGAD
jgi:hypothetical protein